MQAKDLIVTGDARVIGTLYANELNVSMDEGHIIASSIGNGWGKWDWVKFSNGWAMCWGSFSGPAVTTNFMVGDDNDSGTTWGTTGYLTLSYPFAFQAGTVVGFSNGGNDAEIPLMNEKTISVIPAVGNSSITHNIVHAERTENIAFFVRDVVIGKYA